MRVLWSLPKAAPALLRHLAAYIELAGHDLAQTQRDIASSLVALVVAAVALIFAVLMSCLGVVALTWDTPHRVVAIAWMAGGFLIIGVVALIYRSNLIRGHARMLSSVRREWQEDRVILERILSDEN